VLDYLNPGQLRRSFIEAFDEQPFQHSSAGMHAGESEAPSVGEESGDVVTGRALSASVGSCRCLRLSRRLLGSAGTFALKGSMRSDEDAPT
jgi:hypothetical protein